MNNRIFCTFSEEDSLENTIEQLKHKYTILYGRMYVLYSPDSQTYLTTYNVDTENISCFPKDTILVHRKKESKTLYTINALNLLIKKLNNNKLDTHFPIKWEDYQNSLLLVKNLEFVKLNTQLRKVVEV